jgi:hypothetical protein
VEVSGTNIFLCLFFFDVPASMIYVFANQMGSSSISGWGTGISIWALSPFV